MKLVLAAVMGAVLAQGADLAGSYSLRNVREAGSELLLRPDGTFQYMFAYGAADYWGKGKWRAEKGVVVLTGDRLENDKPFRLLRSSAVHKPEIRVRVVGANGQGIPNIDVVAMAAKEPMKQRTDSEGIAYFPQKAGIRGVSFQIRVYGFASDVMDINPAHDEFTFEINGAAITCVPFAETRLRVEENSLVMPNWGGGEQPLVYSRNE